MSDALTYLMGNRWTKDAEGEFITVEDSHAVPPVSFGAEGKSTQVTTTGKNLFDPSELEAINNVQVLGNGIYAFPTPLSQFSGKHIWTNPGLTGTHVVSYERMNANISGSGGGGIRLRVYYTNGTSSYIGNTDKQPSWVRSSAVLDMTNVSYITVTYNSSQLTWLRNLQIEAGSTLTAYEPYSGGAPSPSPAFSQSVESIDALALVMDNVAEPLFNNLTWYQGTARAASDGFIYGSVTSIRTTLTESAAVASGTTYYLHVADGFELYVLGYTGLDQDTYYPDDTIAWAQDITWTPTQSQYVRFLIHRTDGGVIEPDALTGFVASLIPLSVTTAPDLLPDGYSLRSLPDGTKDELHLTYLRPSDRPGWAWYDRELVECTGEVTYQDGGFTGVSASGAEKGFKRLKPSAVAYTGSLSRLYVSNMFTRASESRPNNTIYNYHGNLVCLTEDASVVPSGLTTEGLAEFNEWNLTHPIQVVYKRQTPITTQLDPIELPSMQQGLTNIWSDPSTNLSVTYERNKNIVISNMKATLDDLATS